MKNFIKKMNSVNNRVSKVVQETALQMGYTICNDLKLQFLNGGETVIETGVMPQTAPLVAKKMTIIIRKDEVVSSKIKS